ncbi:MAG TPA: hypothetical protein VH166_05045 [Mycobacterium sp.]|nr:hypothetical protein [Mycobacterium sp.]
MGRDGGPDSGYTIDQHLAPTGAAAHELASAGHRWILIKLSLRETQQRQVEAHMRRLSAVCLQKVLRGAPRRALEPDELVAVAPHFPSCWQRPRPAE